MVGSEWSRRKLYEWLKAWRTYHSSLGVEREPPTPSVLIVGPTGTGKTLAVTLAAKALDLELFTIDLSDARTRASVEKLVSDVLGAVDLFGKRKLLVFDCLEGALINEELVMYFREILGQHGVPVVFISTKEDKSIEFFKRRLRGMFELLRFRKIPPRLIELYLGRVIKEERIDIERSALFEVTKISNGDVRAAILALQQLAAYPSSMEEVGQKTASYTVEESVRGFLSASSPEEAGEYLRGLEESTLMPSEKLKIIFYSLLASRIPRQKLVAALRALASINLWVKLVEASREWSVLKWFNKILLLHHKELCGIKRVAYSDGEFSWDLRLKYLRRREYGELLKKLRRAVNASTSDTVLHCLPVLYAYLVSKRTASKTKEYLMRKGLDPKEIEKVVEIARGVLGGEGE